jgi:hypothetical protein
VTNGGEARLLPRHPATGPACSQTGGQRRSVRVHGTASRPARPGARRVVARRDGLDVLQEDEGAGKDGGTPESWVNGDEARPAI